MIISWITDYGPEDSVRLQTGRYLFSFVATFRISLESTLVAVRWTSFSFFTQATRTWISPFTDDLECSKRFWGSHGDADVDSVLLCCDATWFCRWVPSFRVSVSLYLGWSVYGGDTFSRNVSNHLQGHKSSQHRSVQQNFTSRRHHCVNLAFFGMIASV